MDINENLLKDLIKTKRALKRKYMILKTGKIMNEAEFETTFKPIVEPLKEIVKNVKNANSRNNAAAENDTYDKVKHRRRRRLEFHSSDVVDRCNCRVMYICRSIRTIC